MILAVATIAALAAFALGGLWSRRCAARLAQAEAMKLTCRLLMDVGMKSAELGYNCGIGRLSPPEAQEMIGRQLYRMAIQEIAEDHVRRQGEKGRPAPTSGVDIRLDAVEQLLTERQFRAVPSYIDPAEIFRMINDHRRRVQQ